MARTGRVSETVSCLELASKPPTAFASRFPVIAGLRVKWDHCKPPGSRVISVHSVVNAAPNGDDPEDEYENPEDLVRFFEQEDGTRVEVRQRTAILGEEIKRDDTSRMYRLVSAQSYRSSKVDNFSPDHP